MVYGGQYTRKVAGYPTLGVVVGGSVECFIRAWVLNDGFEGLGDTYCDK